MKGKKVTPRFTLHSCRINAASKSVTMSCIIILYEKFKNYSMQSLEDFFFFVFFLFCFFLLSNNTLHVMSCTYRNTFHDKYIMQITFHVVKRSYVQVTSKDICLLFIILFIYLFPFSLDFVLLHKALLLFCYIIDLLYSYM